MTSRTDIAASELLPRFGLKNFRPGQDEVVASVLRGEDVLCVMPTGGGKSLCYQLPSLAKEGTAIVVSPLIALMKDQVDSLKQRGIAAGLINSSLSTSEQNAAMQQLAEGKFDLLYVAPERLRNSRFLEAVGQTKVSMLAVDEAHCISEWGHDFRPDYARLGLFRQRYLKNIQTIALTATATPAVREDICNCLQLQTPRMFITGFARSNLRFQVQQCKSDREKDDWLQRYLMQQKGSGIIYAATRKRCEELAGWLPEKLRRPIGVYHAGLEPVQRKEVQEQFMSGKLAAIVATNAFGMGIDKADLRFVIHYNMPGTLEAYYQEAGRAGRDGLTSECTLLFSYADRHIQEFFIENRYPTAELVERVYQFLLQYQADPIELTLAEVRDQVDRTASPEAIGTAETLLAKTGVLKRLDSSSNHAVVRIESDLPTLVDLLPREAKLRRKVMQAVEKVVGEHRREDVYVQPQRLCEIAGVTREQLSRLLRELSGLQQFDYVPPFRGRAVHIVRRDQAFADLGIDFEELARRKDLEYDKLESVIGFARTARCRQREILDYFGDTHGGDCKMCDRCQPLPPQLGVTASESLAAATTAAEVASKAASGKSLPLDDPDLTRGIRVVLSGVARTHGRFGKGIVAQMLCGSQNKKIQQWKLHRLSTYGMLEALRQTQVTDVIDALMSAGLVQQVEVEQRRPTIQLSEFGREVMMGRVAVPPAVQLAYPLAKQLARVASKLESADVSASEVHDSQEPPTIQESTTSHDIAQQQSLQSGELNSHGSADVVTNESVEDDPPSQLIGQLKRWRRRVSAASGLPAFRILTNATLERIAEARPTTIGELEAIAGVGPATIEEYGFDLLELVVHSGGVDLAAPAAEPADSPESQVAPPPKVDPAPRVIPAPHVGPVMAEEYWSCRLLKDGYTAKEVAEIRRLNWRQLVAHLRMAGEAGQIIQPQWVESLRPTAEFGGDSVESTAEWKELAALVSESVRG